ncbi:MAG: hypothetical protein HYY13_12140 [Nitrospirae bacterium]|nr:hypothetical protein [Nitrospirota bacterium]
MRFVTVKELHERTSLFVRGEQTAVVTLRGKPKAILQPISEEDIEEAWLRSAQVRRRIDRALSDLAAGRTVAHTEAGRRLFGKPPSRVD